MNKITFLLSTIIAQFMLLQAQGLPLPFDEDFSSGIPSNWTQQNNDPQWFHSTTNNLVFSSYYGSTVPGPDNWLNTPYINTSTVSDPKLYLDVQMTTNSTWCVPVLELWYSTDGTQYSLLGKVGLFNPCSSGVDVELNPGNWHNIVAAVPSSSNILFRLKGNFIGSGRIAIDNVQINDSRIVGSADQLLPSAPYALYLPSQGKVTFYQVKKTITWSLINIQGKRIASGEARNGESIDVAFLAKGLYILEMKQHNASTPSYTKFIF